MNQEEITKAFRNFWIDDCWNHASLHHQMQSYCHLRSWHTSSLDSHHHGLWTCTLDLLNHLAMGALVWHTTWAFSVWLNVLGFLFFLSIDRIKKVFELYYQWLRFYKKTAQGCLVGRCNAFFLLFLCLCFQFFGLTLGFLFWCLFLFLLIFILFLLLSLLSLHWCRFGRAGLLSLFPLRFLFVCGLLLLFLLCLFLLRVEIFSSSVVHSGGEEMDTKRVRWDERNGRFKIIMNVCCCICWFTP